MHIKILLVQCLGFIGDREAVPFLLEQARSGPSEVRPHAVDALGPCGDSSAVPDLIKLLDSDSVEVRKFAPRALGMLGDDRAVEPLRKRLGDAHPDVQWNAACALGYYFRDPSGAPLLRQMLDRRHVAGVVKGDHAELKIANAMVAALNAVVSLGDKGFLPAVEGVAKGDPNPSVRHAAQQAMNRLKQ
jgi:HEAT repeat protein